MSITDAIKADLDARTAKGIATYGHPLTPNMGEDMLHHLYEELLDAAQYVKTRLVEEKTTYQCYWRDRALTAEKKLSEMSSTPTADPVVPDPPSS